MAEQTSDETELTIVNLHENARYSGTDVLQRTQAAEILTKIGLKPKNALILVGLVSAKGRISGDDTIGLEQYELD